MCPTSPPTSTAFFQGSARFVYKPWLDPQAHLFFQPFFYGCWFYHYTFRRTSFITGAHTRRLPPFSLFFFYNFFHCSGTSQWTAAAATPYTVRRRDGPGATATTSR